MSPTILTRREAGRAAPVPSEPTRELAGIHVAAATAKAAARVLSARLDARIGTRLAFLNAHGINLSFESADYREALSRFIVLPDGVGVDMASQVLHGRPFPANLNGTDFVPFLLRSLKRPLRVALIGSQPGVAERAAERLTEDTPQHVFLPVAHGFFAEGAETAEVLRRLREAKADIVLVALGVPRQELFIARHLGPDDPPLAIGVGAFLDFAAGRVPRAPRVLRQVRLEWIFRLLLEPRRLWKRYVVGNPTFLRHVWRERRRAMKAIAAADRPGERCR